MTLRTIRTILLLATFFLLVPACNKDKKYRIAVSQCSADDWRNKMNQEIEREILFHPEAEVEIVSADDSNEKQIADIRRFAREGFDVIIAAPNEAAAITPVIDSVMKAGIPVVVFDRTVLNKNYTAFQGADNDSVGVQAAQYIAAATGGNARIIEIFGNPGSTPAQGRHNGFVRALAAYPSMTLLASGVGMWNDTDAFRVADSLLRIYPETSVVYAHNDRMAIQARRAARNLGLNPLVVGIDGAPEVGMKAVREGDIDATFLYPTGGHQLVRTALSILDGKPYDRELTLPASSAIDRANAPILLAQNEALKEETNKIVALQSRLDQYWEQHSAQKLLLYLFIALVAFLVLSLLLFLRVFWQRRRHQQELQRQNLELEKQRDTERRLNEKLREATASKLAFYTNVSHDFRTPLTLITEPVRQLMASPGLSERQKSLLSLADKNIKILQRLINQLLDFRKYENQHLRLNPQEIDIASLLSDWTSAFLETARRRNIRLKVEIDPAVPPHLAADTEKMERIMFNLISNAFKYSPDNSTVRVRCHIEGPDLVVRVADNGSGIPEADLPNIFDRFYRVDKVRPNGSGIGLALAKAFAELHGGSLTVESQLGRGTEFTLAIPVNHIAENAATTSSTITADTVEGELRTIEPITPETPPAPDVPQAHEATGDVENPEQKLPLLLVIDDSRDILILISSLLQSDFRVITATDGAEGVRMAAKYVPDIIVCDVMMPVMDGLEATRRIKSEVSTSHIPVLMLTACSLDEQRVEGYESGADGYLSKPFNAEVLRARCHSLVANRHRIYNLYTNTPDVATTPGATPAAPETKGTRGAKNEKPLPRPLQIDNEFYNRFLETFRRNMANADLNVDTLAAEMGLGRSQFYRKIKALTNYSPVELIRNIRLKEARNQLLTTEKNVSEIAYAVGFSTPAYFTKCYREAYGETPSDTRTNLTR